MKTTVSSFPESGSQPAPSTAVLRLPVVVMIVAALVLQACSLFKPQTERTEPEPQPVPDERAKTCDIAGARYAIVSGSNDYTSLAELRQAKADAVLISETLTTNGYEVRKFMDTPQEKQEQMRSLLETTSKGASAVFVYWAGHAVEHNGLNYLLPVDFPIGKYEDRSEDDASVALDLARDALSVDDLVGASSACATFIVIDACRTDILEPPPRRGVRRANLPFRRNLAAPTSTPGVFLMYSTSSGRDAADDGVFADALNKHLKRDPCGRMHGELMDAANIFLEESGQQPTVTTKTNRAITELTVGTCVNPKPPSALPGVALLVEVGSKGIKPVVVRYTSSGQVELWRAYDKYNVDPADQDSPFVVESLMDAITTAIDDFELELEPEQIVVVGSSGLHGQRHGTSVQNRINQALQELGVTMTFVESAEEEAKLTFAEVVRCDLMRWGGLRVADLEHRRRQVVVLDIGSGNTKGAYVVEGVQDPCSPVHVRGFEIPYGSITLATKARSESAEPAEAAQKLVRPKALRVAARHSLHEKTRYYLTGGISWVFARLTYPNDDAPYVRLQPKHIDDFVAQALDNPDCLLDTAMVERPDPKVCRWLDVDFSTLPRARRLEMQLIHRNIRGAFGNVDHLQAGAALLKELSDDLQFKGKKPEDGQTVVAPKTLFFAAAGDLAWLRAYGRKLVKETENPSLRVDSPR